MDKAKLFADRSAVEARLLELEEPHVEPLTAFVKKLRATKGANFAFLISTTE